MCLTLLCETCGGRVGKAGYLKVDVEAAQPGRKG